MMLDSINLPSRIVCLTEESTEILYALGEEARIVGISGYTVRPPQARRDKPKVSAFISANTERIMALKPDLVIGFSDIQADIARSLIAQGINVLVFNQRSIVEILSMIKLLSAMVGAMEKGEQLIQTYTKGLAVMSASAQTLPKKPRIYFEEWDEPLICGIRWVSELIALAGGIDCFADQAQSSLARGRVIDNPAEVIARAPDIIIGSWCGKKFRPERARARAGWHNIPAVRNNHLYEIKSPLILQPGPAALTDGVRAIADIINRWALNVKSANQ